jgi:catechol 2,3-dioxygenase-like lactoylglutathione lyase family enzyme
VTGLRIAAIRLLCADVARTRAFYTAAFGCRPDDGAGLRLGDQRLELVPAAGPAAPPAPANSTAFQHFAIVVPDMAAARRGLDAVTGWSALSRDGPQVLPAASGGVTAFKFRDPDGHPLELLQFADGGWPDGPAGVARALYRGIDHSAITVADTDRAIAFYAGLGFSVAHRGVNRGAEQQRLDAVPDPIVEVTALRPPGGVPPHLELLCYRRPATVAEPPAPGDPRATRLVLRAPGPAVPELERRDPDGHTLVLPA